MNTSDMELKTWGDFLADDQQVTKWVHDWEGRGKAPKGAFKALFEETRQEAHRYLTAIPDFLERPSEDYYRFVGALSPETKGSGLATVCAAIFLYHRFSNAPEQCIYAAVNLLGSDTDTISSFLGSLLGARHGFESVPKHLLENIQDREYLLKTADRLHAVVAGGNSEQFVSDRELDRQDAYLRILAWEIGLHEMFWDAIDIGNMVVHPALGRGKITSKEIRKIAREGYVAKLIDITFDCGQTCVFHSRVQDNGKVSESLAEDIAKALNV